MCLNPIKLHNQKKDVYLNGGQSFDIEVPCGKCSECLERAKSDWYFRTYYEAKSTFDRCGYVYFDTLTYDDDHLPHINDFLPEEYKVSYHLNMPCFNVEHYRKFFVRLRRALEYRGYAKSVKYFLTSEYGDDDRFTHRPHYHVLFFVNTSSLSPLLLSELVSQCWQMGRTDGIPFKSANYVMNHVFGYSFNPDTVHMQMVCNYVAKYVAKDSTFSKEVEKRLDNIFEGLFGYGFELDLDGRGRKLYAELRTQCLQFHRQSQGFGDDFLHYNDYEEVKKTGMISMPDSKNLIRHTPLPSYYQRKLFYDLLKDADGVRRWKVNSEGIDYKLIHAKKSVELLTQRLIDWSQNMYEHNYYHDSADTEWYEKIISSFGRLNNGRNISQFAEYLVFYRGRIKSAAQLEREENGIYEVDEIDSFYKSQFVEKGEKLYFYGTNTDYHVFGGKFVSKDSKGTIKDYEKEGLLDNINRYAKVFDSPKSVEDGSVMTVGNFKKRYVINDKCDSRFKDYDKMWSLYCEAQLDKNDWKEASYNERMALRKRLKSIGVFVKTI